MSKISGPEMAHTSVKPLSGTSMNDIKIVTMSMEQMMLTIFMDNLSESMPPITEGAVLSFFLLAFFF